MSNAHDAVQEKVGRLLPSQKLWMYSPETERVDMGGWRAGKSRVLCTAGMLLSYLIPDNFGFIGRASGKDLHSTTIQTFFDEVCPPEMVVGKPRKVGQSGLEVVLRTRYEGYTSKIYFDYIVDKSSGKSHLAGGNWGWHGVDQLEEIKRGDWHKLMGRLSRTYFDPTTRTRKPIKTHALGVGNQMGHDWIFEDFFEGGDYIFDLKGEPSRFFKTVRRDHRLGVIVRSEENMMSNGGFVPDEYYTNLRRTMPKSWQARYMDGSFDDFSGKILADYNPSSIHNIEPFRIPAHWPSYAYIDPGGSAPWAIGLWRVDEAGNRILVDDAPSLYQRVNPNHVANWLLKHTDVTRTRFIIDYQNIPVMDLLRDAGIHCEPAMKDHAVGINGAIADFYINPERLLPQWFLDTQPRERVATFKGKGSPRVFAFNTCRNWAKEHDNYIWDPVKKNEPKSGQADHHCDGTRYFLASSPQSAIPVITDPFAAFRDSDPNSALHQEGVAKEMARWRCQKAMERFENAEVCEGGETGMDYIAEYF